mgnify:CR=1 FL=1
MITAVASIITAIISAAGAFMGAVLTVNKKMAVLETKLDGMKEDINKLSDRVDQHNHFNERMVKVEVEVDNVKKAAV